MESSYEYAEEASLLCAEEDKSIFDEEIDNYGLVVDDSEICHKEDIFIFSGGLELEQIIVQSDECLASMFEKEIQHLPALGYFNRFTNGDLDLGSRKLAIQWIEKVQYHYNFGPLCVYLAINYLDRFLSAYELPRGKDWMMQLLAVACLSLAAKMDETQVPLTLDLQVGEARFVFEAKTIQRMELIVLSTLKWRMQAVTPFSFIEHFLKKINEDQIQIQRQPKPKGLVILHCIQLILSTIKGIEFLEFRPSEIAAAVAISISEEETQMPENTVRAFPFLSDNVVKRERVVECVKLIHEMRWSSRRSKGRSGSSTSVPQSPIGVLDAACMSYYTQQDASMSCASACPAPKRRKLARTFNLDF